MYGVLLERGAEKDLTRLSFEVRDRVVAAIKSLGLNRARLDAENLSEANTTGGSGWMITA